MPRPLLFCLKSGRSVCYSVPDNIQHYRKMSNQRMADETREVRQRMSDIIYMSLARWGEEYEQIRQDD